MALPINLPQTAYIKGFWKLDEESGNRADETTGNHTATDVNTVGSDTGKINLGANFVKTSSEHFTIVEHADLKPTGNYSIAAWVKTSDTGAYKGVFQSVSADPNWAGIVMRIDDSNHIQAILGYDEGTMAAISGSTNVCDGAWHHLACTYDGTDLKIYIDAGAAEDSVACGTPPVYSTTTYIRIGCSNSTGSELNYFEDLIDEVIVWNGVALSQAEVLAVKNITAYEYAAVSGFSGVSSDCWIFLKDMWEKHNKIWRPNKKILIPQGI